MKKDPQVQAVYELPRVKKFIDRKARNSTKTSTTYLSALVKLRDYLQSKSGTSTISSSCDSIIDALTDKKEDIYDLLDGYISYLQSIKLGITPSSISNYITALKSYFAFYDIDIIPAKFRNKVSLPKNHRQDELAIDASDIRKILLSCNNRRLKSYLLVLSSSALRAKEACSIRNKDVLWSSSPAKIPTRIHIRAEHTKTKTARDVYISDEAADHLKQWKEFKYSNRSFKESEEDLIFAAYKKTSGIRNIYSRLQGEFTKLLAAVKMDERKESGIAEKRRRLITLHSLRRYCKSAISEQVSTDYSEWFLGHNKSPYWTVKEAKRAEIYISRCMPTLTFLDFSHIEATGRSVEARLEAKDREMTSLRQEYADRVADVHKLGQIVMSQGDTLKEIMKELEEARKEREELKKQLRG